MKSERARLAQRTLVDLLVARGSSSHGITLVEARGVERALDYASLARRARVRLAELDARGAAVGDALIILVEDRLAFLEFFWAATLGGLVPVPVAGGISDEHRDKLLRIAATLGGGAAGGNDGTGQAAGHGPWLVTETATFERLEAHVATRGGDPAFARLRERLVRLGGDEGPGAEAVPEPPPRAPHVPSADDVALIQFSSGSTGSPKGVVLTHANLLTNLDGILDGMAMRDDDTMLSWMPLTHDMGLIGFHLTPLAADIDQVLMPTDVFVRRPAGWLAAATRHRATVLCSPNFGYEHLLKSFRPSTAADVDLSSVRLVFNGAEPISAALCRRFVETLAPLGLAPAAMFPVYGLAEASLAVSFPAIGEPLVTRRLDRAALGVGQRVRDVEADAGAPERARNGHEVGAPAGARAAGRAVEIVAVGRAIRHVEFRIADDVGNELDDDVVGHVLIRGANVTAGYLIANGARDRSSIDADGWLATGDLGFVAHGTLYITGRDKDIVFVGGQNLYPHDLENLLIEAGLAEAGKVAIAAAPSDDIGHDRLCVFVQHRGDIEALREIVEQVRRTLALKAGVAVDLVVPVPRLPKTTSGKVQRFRLVEQWGDGDFDVQLAALGPQAPLPVGPVPGGALDAEDDAKVDGSDGSTGDSTVYSVAGPKDAPGTSVEERLLAICRRSIESLPVGPDDNLFDLGISSLTLAEIHADIEDSWPGVLDITDLFDHPTPREIAAVLVERS